MLIGERLRGRDAAYVLTVRDGRVHVIAHRVDVDGSVVSVVAAGGSLGERLDVDPRVTLLWPPVVGSGDDEDRYSLIADGDGRRVGDRIEISVTSAMLHRPAP